MYNLIIVDDEEIIRKGLSDIIDWESIGFRVSSLFSNAFDALQFVKNNDVHVVLTDIRMPKVSGIDLIEMLKKVSPEIKTIFISGYSDFSCAQKAVEFGAYRYILKPTREEEILEIFTGLKTLLDQEVKNKRHVFENRNYMLGEIASRFAAKRQTESDEEYFNKLFKENGSMMAAMRLELFPRYTEKSKDSIEEKQVVLRLIHETIERFSSAEIIRLPRLSNDQICMLVFTNEDVGKACVQLYKDVKNAVIEYKSFSFAAAYGEAVTTPDGVGGTLNTAEILLNNIFIKSPCLLPYDTEKQFEAEEFSIKNLSDETVTCLKQRCIRKIEIKMPKYINWLIQSPDVNSQYVYNKILKLIKVIRKTSESKGLIAHDSSITDSKLFAEISKYKTPNDLSALIISKLREIEDEMHEYDKSVGKRFVKKTIEIINMKYSESLKLSDVADEMMISPEHLSRTIKKETGKNYKDFLMEVRLSRAKELLKKSELKIYEIAELTGFSSQHYFSTVFKSYSGMTPVEFREMA